MPDPLAPENLLKGSGRGIFLIRSFMDEMVLQRAAGRGHGDGDGETRQSGAGPRLSERVNRPDPVFLATAVEIVLRAGEIQMARRESGFRIDKKGAIDLVTEVDLECERMCRAVIAERFPDHDVLAEELSSGPTERPALVASLGVRSARRDDELRARPADLLLVAGARDRRASPRSAAVYDPTRRELFTAERGEGAFLNGGASGSPAADG